MKDTNIALQTMNQPCPWDFSICECGCNRPYMGVCQRSHPCAKCDEALTRLLPPKQPQPPVPVSRVGSDTVPLSIVASSVAARTNSATMAAARALSPILE